MRKHFLILMLLALLPLTGFAADVAWPEAFADLSDGWSIRLSQTAATYTGTDIRPNVVLVKTKDASDVYVLENGFNVSWSAEDVIDFASAGYTVTVTADDTKTFGALAKPTAKFMVMKANVDETTAGVLNDVPLVYHNGDAFNLLKSNGGTPETFKEPVAKIVGTTTEVPVLYSIDNKTTWLAAGVLPTASQVGTYSVWYKVEATNNYNAFEKKIGDIEIAGTPQADGTDYDAPTINGGASTLSDNHFTFAWNNGAPVAQKLLTDNTGKMKKAASGTMYFKVNDGEWSTERPTASAAGTYVISWKIVGGVGMADVDATVLGTKIIDKADVEITFTVAANAKTGQKYNVAEGHERALLKAAATTANGAPVKYQTRYKATSAEDYPGIWSATKYTNYLDVKGTNAGYYQVRAFVEGEDNYNDNTTAEPIEIQIAKTDQYFTTAPAAATLTYTGADQQLITATPSEAGLVKYSVAATASQAAIADETDITQIVGTDAGNYEVTYEVAGNDNFVATTAPVTITGTKINKKDMSVKVNNITKSYNGLVESASAVVDNGLDKFTFMGRVADGVDFSTVDYKALDESCKNAGSYTNAVTVTEAALNAKSENYIYTIIPGNLTIAKSKLTVTAKDDIEVLFGTVYDISNEYNVAGVAAGEELTDVFSTLPVLYTDAPTPNPAPEAYDLFFTKGTLKATNNYEMSDAGEDHDGYVIGAAKFTVVADPAAKIIITVLPHTQTYTGVGEDWSGIEAGVDYVVTGLINGDALTVAPQFKRKDYNDDDDATNDKFGVGVYDLEAYGAEVADLSKYPGKIVYQKSTFEITKAPLTVTINQQTVPVTSPVSALDQTDWTVEGLVGPDVKKDLNGVLSYNTSYGDAADQADVANAGSYAKGIELKITNGNYELTGANVNTTDASKAYGRLIVIAANTIALQVTDEDLQAKLTTAQTADANYQVTFAGDSRVMEAKEWYAMVLPFETTPLELAKNLNTYVVVNLLKSSKIEFNSKTNRDEAIVNFGIEMDKIPAGTPFLIKPAAKTKWNTVENATNIYTPRKIKAAVVPTVTDKATLSATYETGKSLQWGYELDGTTENADMKYRWLANTTDLQAGSTTEYRDNAWYNCKSNAHALEPMEAFLILDPAAQGARIFVEDFENGTTAIQSLNADEIKGLKVAEGWYTINGIKLQSMPTEKGIYINNGKKVVIK